MAFDKSLNNKKINDKTDNATNATGATSANINSEKALGNKRKLRRAVSSSDEECEVSPGAQDKQSNINDTSCGDNAFSGQTEMDIGNVINALFPSHPNKKKLTTALKTVYNRIIGDVAHRNQPPCNVTTTPINHSINQSINATTHPNNIPICPSIYGQGLDSLMYRDIITETIATESNAILTEKRLLLERRLADARTRVIIANAELSVLGKNECNVVSTPTPNMNSRTGSNSNLLSTPSTKKNSLRPSIELLPEKTKKNWITIMVPNDRGSLKPQSKENRKKKHDDRLFDEECITTTTETDLSDEECETDDEEYETDDVDEDDYETDDDEDYETDDDDDDEDVDVDEDVEEDVDEWETADEEEDDEDETRDVKCKDTSTENWAETATVKKMKEFLSGISEEDQKNPIIKNIVDEMKKSEKTELTRHSNITNKSKRENTKKFKLLLKNKDEMNDLRYFHDKLDLEQQKEVIKKIETVRQNTTTDKPRRLVLLESDIPIELKSCALKKMAALRMMDPSCTEHFKMEKWLDTFMRIPFGIYKSLNINMGDGIDKCDDFMKSSSETLNDAVYGLNDAKMQIMQMIGQWIVNPGAIGTSIAIQGPMGTGKTTLVKEGISKILGRDFVFIPLGGATDSTFLEGHSYTYEGSNWGKIVDVLIKSKSMNPVIFFDELDKVSSTAKGEEITGILTHLTDSTQNSQFSDKYFSEIDFDLSKCLFIFSYNDESKVNRILLDRMYKIHTKGYNPSEKLVIARKHLIPKICEQVKFELTDITLSDEVIQYIVSNYTGKEDGVRNLKRCIEIIYTKLNLYRLIKPDTKILDQDMSIKIAFPLIITNAIVDKLIKTDNEQGAWTNMYV